ncbi:O10V1 protein, partial [Crocuta crocuta]
MEEENQTGVVYFHFHPFSMDPAMAPLLFVAFLLLFLGSLVGNVTIGLTIWRDHSLHTPMYFFLFVLAVLEIGYSTNIAPLTLASILSVGHMLISLPSCGAQMFFFILLGGSDCVLLAVMAYDRYVAICHPLHYHVIMSWRLCGQMTVGSLGLGFLLGAAPCHPQVQCTEYMEATNQTGMIRFHFRPFSKLPEVQMLIFVAFLIMYLVSIGGNGSISLIIWINHSLHTPMYFFLASLAALEICYSSTIAPLTLASVLSAERALISLPGCGAQMFFFIFLGSADCILLAVMAYDRFVAICHPLRYTLMMSWPLCVQLALGSLVLAFILAMQLTVLIFQLPFCRSKEISLFYCDVLPVLRLACADTWVHEAILFVVSLTVLTIPFLLIALSYVFIVAAILKIRSAEGRHRAFSTCSSHLT